MRSLLNIQALGNRIFPPAVLHAAHRGRRSTIPAASPAQPAHANGQGRSAARPDKQALLAQLFKPAQSGKAAQLPSPLAGKGQLLRGIDVQQIQQRLITASSTINMEITAADGRRAQINVQASMFDYQETYTRASLAQVREMQVGNDSRLESAREFLVQHGQAEFLGVSGHSLEVSISGDQDLVRSYFAAEPTAQRIFDFVSRLGASAGITDVEHPRFPSFHDAITRGVSQGFGQARSLLGGQLAPVSYDTRTLLDGMLAAFREDGQPQKAEDFRHLLSNE